jgi:hypothetical protein
MKKEKSKDGWCDCRFPKWKIVRSHGKKSRGYFVCKICKGVLRDEKKKNK